MKGPVLKSVAARDMEVRGPVRSTTLWTVALGSSLVLNLFLFDFMPRLIKRDTGGLQSAPYIEKVNVIRLKRPEPPARRKVKEEPPEPERKPESEGRYPRRPPGWPRRRGVEGWVRVRFIVNEEGAGTGYPNCGKRSQRDL